MFDNSQLIICLEEIHIQLDEMNAKHGTKEHLCIFCRSNVYSGNEGIEHATSCPVLRLRGLIRRIKEEKADYLQQAQEMDRKDLEQDYVRLKNNEDYLRMKIAKFPDKTEAMKHLEAFTRQITIEETIVALRSLAYKSDEIDEIVRRIKEYGKN